jgi:endonuclease-3
MCAAPVDKTLAVLQQLYPNAQTELVFSSPWQLLVATLLSAQCTDKRVNLITPRLFARFPDPKQLAQASQEEVEQLIRDCGLYRTKARHLIQTAQTLVERYGGVVPNSLDDLMQLPGVGRKTANVVLANAFGVPAIAVDTHVFRVSHRLGWSQAKDPQGTERDLMALIPQPLWNQTHHWLIFHGRRVCRAVRPQCDGCALNSVCPHASGPSRVEASAAAPARTISGG